MKKVRKPPRLNKLAVDPLIIMIIIIIIKIK
jgi:hypothetical protein